MHIDCEGCGGKPAACGDCVVSVVLGAPPDGVRLDAGERRALDVLAASGLVPPLRLAPVAHGGEGSAARRAAG